MSKFCKTTLRIIKTIRKLYFIKLFHVTIPFLSFYHKTTHSLQNLVENYTFMWHYQRTTSFLTICIAKLYSCFPNPLWRLWHTQWYVTESVHWGGISCHVGSNNTCKQVDLDLVKAHLGAVWTAKLSRCQNLSLCFRMSFLRYLLVAQQVLRTYFHATHAIIVFVLVLHENKL